MKYCRFLCLFALLLLWGCSAPASGPNPGAIVPGQGVKEVAVGASREDVEKALGAPDTLSKNPFNADNVIAEYFSKGLEISYDRDRAGSIVIHPEDGKYKAYEGSTKEGAWVGSTPAEVKKLMGEPVKELSQALIYDGLWVRLTKDGKIESISIE